ncbi:MAG: ABC transporter permease, partial [Planctomycetota bacterium]
QAGAGLDAQRGTEQAIKRFREKYKLDEPLPVQFGYFVKRLTTGDLIFFNTETPVWKEMKPALIVTAQLNAVVFVLVYIIAIPIGIQSAARPNGPLDRVSSLFLFMLYSLPTFWTAEMLRLWLTGPGEWQLPVLNLHSDNYKEFSYLGQVADWWWHAILPITCLTYGGMAYISRQMRAGMIEVMRQDYVRTAWAKGCPEWRVVLVHALRNGLFPIITLFASLLPFLIGGSVIVEVIFNIDGMGKFAFENMLRREYDAVMASLVLSAVLTLFGILLSDILYVLVNPQVSFDKRGG